MTYIFDITNVPDEQIPKRFRYESKIPLIFKQIVLDEQDRDWITYFLLLDIPYQKIGKKPLDNYG
jgi:hypothetical protein